MSFLYFTQYYTTSDLSGADEPDRAEESEFATQHHKLVAKCVKKLRCSAVTVQMSIFYVVDRWCRGVGCRSTLWDLEELDVTVRHYLMRRSWMSPFHIIPCQLMIHLASLDAANGVGGAVFWEGHVFSGVPGMGVTFSWGTRTWGSFF